jgi:serine/threonine-protein kinase
MSDLIGKTIQGYKIIQVLGRGGMGIVYRAYEINLERYVAIKFLKNEIFDNPNMRERFKREAKNQAKMNHQNIVTVYGFLDYEGMLGIVMEYVEGNSLDKIIFSKRRLHMDDVIYLMKQILDAVGYAHGKGFIHRDIKPSNIIITKDGMAKIMDFGISKSVFDDSSVTRTGAKVGTPFYMSPEQIKGHNVTYKTDIYALGCTLYEMITGDPPFMGDSEFEVLEAHTKKEPPLIHKKFPDIPPIVDEIVGKALAKNPDERYHDCREFFSAIVKFEKLKTYSPAGAAFASSKKKKSKVLPISVFAGIIIVLLVVMKLIVSQVDGIVKSPDLLKLEKYNLNNFFSSGGEINFESMEAVKVPTKNNINHIEFVTENIGFAMADSGFFLRTVDGGDSWQQVKITGDDSTSVFDKSNLYSGYIFNNGLGFVVGQSGTVIRTTDLFQTAERLPFHTSSSLFDITFITGDVGVIVGSKGVIYRTEDGGKTWYAVDNPSKELLYDVEFPNKDLGVAVGWNGTILRTTDSGLKWETMESGTMKYLKSVTFKNSDYAIAVGGGNNIWITNDGAETWKASTISNAMSLSKVKFLDNITVLAIGNRGTIIISKDSGLSWKKVESKLYYPFTDFEITKDGKLFIAGGNGTLLRVNPKTK